MSVIKVDYGEVGGSAELIIQTTTNMHDTWYDTGVPCDEVISICAIGRDYKYMGYFGLYNGSLTWLNGLSDAGGAIHQQFFQIDTSGSTLKIKSIYGGNGIHDLYITKS